MFPRLLSTLLLAVPAAPGVESHFDQQGLTLDLGALSEVQVLPGAGDGQLRGYWSAKLADRRLSISMLFLPRGEFGLRHPNDTLSLIESHKQRSQPSLKAGGFAFEHKEFLPGSFGALGFAGVGVHDELEGTKPVKTVLVLSGILPEAAWALEIHSEPALLDEQCEELVRLLTEGIAYGGEVLDPEWSDEELRERWNAEAPAELVEDPRDLYVVRTDHYVILTNQKGNTAKKFGEVMEECYEKIRIIFPFEDVPGQRLLPLFLFRTPAQYHEFVAKNTGMTLEQARRTGGVAFGDCYATYFQSKNDPVHIHEATHQVFRNRLFLGGGGSWLQEGVAEYVCSEPNEFNPVRNLVKKGDVVPLRQLVAMPSLLFSSDQNRVTGGSAGGDAYNQAGILIEYLRQDETHRERFLDFVHAMGRVARNDVPAIERVLTHTLGVTLEELEQELVEYCSGRARKMDRFQPLERLR